MSLWSQRDGTRLRGLRGLNTRKVLSSERNQEDSELPLIYHSDESSSSVICNNMFWETEKGIKLFQNRME